MADENLDRTVIDRLREAGHTVLAVAEILPGADDSRVLDLANRSRAMLLTEDKDFGELAFRQGLVHAGVILIRLAGMPPNSKAAAIAAVLKNHSARCARSFVVILPGRVRIREPQPR